MLSSTSSDHEQSNLWKSIWSLKFPERIRAFILLVKHESLTINLCLSKMHIRDSSCLECTEEIERVIHVVRHYVAVKLVWLSLVRASCQNIFFDVVSQDWMKMNMQINLTHGEIKEWKAFQATTCHSFWFWHNKKIYDDTYVTPTMMYVNIISRSRFYNMSIEFQQHVCIRNKVLLRISQKPPKEYRTLINIDGVAKNNRKVGCDGLV